MWTSCLLQCFVDRDEHSYDADRDEHSYDAKESAPLIILYKREDLGVGMSSVRAARN